MFCSLTISSSSGEALPPCWAWRLTRRLWVRSVAVMRGWALSPC